jgi:hypothetical protein
MSVAEGMGAVLVAKFEVLLPHLDERQRRLFLAAEARALGHGGIRLVARAAGVREATVSLGVRELDSGAAPLGRIRRPGGGRKRVAYADARLRPALLALVEPDMRGDPMSPLRWTTLSTRHLATELTAQGHRMSADTVADLLRQEGFSLQGNAKTLEGKQSPDRDAQFRYLNEQVREHRDVGQPVISVDTKKKELIGEFKNSGREWAPTGEPVKVGVHDFGLRVHAELDTGSYPTGIQIGDADMAGLPITQHAFHGDGNYVLHPTLASATPAGDTESPPTRWSQRMLSDPALTGMSRTQLDSLTAALAELHDAQPGAGLGRPPTLSFPDQVLTAVLHFRLALPAEPLAVLFASSRAAVHRTFHKIKRLLDQHGTIPPAASPPAALAVLHARALALGDQPANKIKSAC